MVEIPTSWDLTKHPKADGTLDLIGKDDAGSEYVARNCPTGHVTDDDLAELKVGDRTQSTARDITNRVVERREAFKREKESQIEDSIAANMGEVVYAGFHGFWGTGYGQGEAQRAANGAAIPRRRRFSCDPTTGLVTER
jgi:hypothetical protein